jgi:hypothetical protein
LAAITVLAETVLRSTTLQPGSMLMGDVLKMCGVLAGVVVELGAQYLASTLLALAALRWRGWYPISTATNVPDPRRDGRQESFQ